MSMSDRPGTTSENPSALGDVMPSPSGMTTPASSAAPAFADTPSPAASAGTERGAAAFLAREAKDASS
jgi:hypothetical protein